MYRIFSLLVVLMVASCSELTRTKDELTQNVQVYAEDALETLKIARILVPKIVILISAP